MYANCELALCGSASATFTLFEPIQYSVNMVDHFGAAMFENLSNTGRTTFRSRAKQQRSIPKITPKIAFPVVDRKPIQYDVCDAGESYPV